MGVAAAAAVVAAAAAETTTTSRSESVARLSARARRASVALAVAAFFVAVGEPGCRRDTRDEPQPSVAPVPVVVPEPAGLLLGGVIRHPGALYERVDHLAGARAQLLPKHLSVAIATTLFDAPLSAGLVDDSAPIALAMLCGDGDDVSTVAAMRLTSGHELVAALTTGSDARFTPQKDASGVTVLSSKTPDSRTAVGVFGDRLLLSDSERALRDAGPFVALSAPLPQDGADIELIANRRALAGPLAAVLHRKSGALRDVFLAAEAVARQNHRGREPDFGEPSAVVNMLSGFTDGFVDALASGTEARLTATLSAELPVVRLELTPAATGAARELTDGITTGTLEPLLMLPDWVQAAFFSRATVERDAGSPWAHRLEAVLGDRLAPGDRAFMRAWLDDAVTGLGASRVAAVFDDSVLGVFLMGAAGDGSALRSATLALPRVLSSKAVADPLQTFLGRLDVAPATAPKGVAAITVRASPKPGSASRPGSVSVMASSVGDRVAILAAHDETAQRIRDVLTPDATHTLGNDTAVISAVERAGAGANAAVVVRVRDDGGDARALVVAFGSDRKVTWAEVGASKAAAETLVRAWIGR
jgi:hypothetical protein